MNDDLDIIVNQLVKHSRNTLNHQRSEEDRVKFHEITQKILFELLDTMGINTDDQAQTPAKTLTKKSLIPLLIGADKIRTEGDRTKIPLDSDIKLLIENSSPHLLRALNIFYAYLFGFKNFIGAVLRSEIYLTIHFCSDETTPFCVYFEELKKIRAILRPTTQEEYERKSIDADKNKFFEGLYITYKDITTEKLKREHTRKSKQFEKDYKQFNYEKFSQQRDFESELLGLFNTFNTKLTSLKAKERNAIKSQVCDNLEKAKIPWQR